MHLIRPHLSQLHPNDDWKNSFSSDWERRQRRGVGRSFFWAADGAWGGRMGHCSSTRWETRPSVQLNCPFVIIITSIIKTEQHCMMLQERKHVTQFVCLLEQRVDPSQALTRIHWSRCWSTPACLSARWDVQWMKTRRRRRECWALMKTSPGYCFADVLLNVRGPVCSVQPGPFILERSTVALLMFYFAVLRRLNSNFSVQAGCRRAALILGNSSPVQPPPADCSESQEPIRAQEAEP